MIEIGDNVAITLDVSADDIETAIQNQTNIYTIIRDNYDAYVGIKFNYFGARYYDAEIGLWVAVDPVDEFFTSYRYTTNPIRFVDFEGKAEGDQVFFYSVKGGRPKHTGYDLGNNKVIMLSSANNSNGEATVQILDLNNYSLVWGDVKFASLNDFVSPKGFHLNVNAIIKDLDAGFSFTPSGDDWDQSGTMCTDIILTGLGKKGYKKLKSEINKDFKKDKSSYTKRFNFKSISDDMMRKNMVLEQYQKNTNNLTTK